MPGEFDGRHVVVTGGSGALGVAIVEAFGRAGATCHVPSRKDGVDLTDEDKVTRWYGALPPIWASIHAAGGFDMAPVVETSLASFKKQFDTNAVSCFLACREAVRSFRRHGGGGRIVNVAARPAVVPAGGMIAYTTSKAAVASITECLAEEVRTEGILVNAVAPSIIDTPANRQAMPASDKTRWPRPADIAQTIVFLASPRNQLTTGTVVPVYGLA